MIPVSFLNPHADALPMGMGDRVVLVMGNLLVGVDHANEFRHLLDPLGGRYIPGSEEREKSLLGLGRCKRSEPKPLEASR